MYDALGRLTQVTYADASTIQYTYDAGNRLLSQAENEVLSQELELGRLAAVLDRIGSQPVDLVALKAPSPFALPLMVERLREQLTTEKLKDRLDRLLAEAEAALADPVPPRPRRGRAGLH